MGLTDDVDVCCECRRPRRGLVANRCGECRTRQCAALERARYDVGQPHLLPRDLPARLPRSGAGLPRNRPDHAAAGRAGAAARERRRQLPREEDAHDD